MLMDALFIISLFVLSAISTLSAGKAMTSGDIETGVKHIKMAIAFAIVGTVILVAANWESFKSRKKHKAMREAGRGMAARGGYTNQAYSEHRE